MQNNPDGKSDEVHERAAAFANANKKSIARRLTDISKFPPDSIPITVFMAGSPGAGKTESAKNLILDVSANHEVLRIDSDEVRVEFPDYNGSNSFLFQGAASIVTDHMQDLALKNGQSYIFDGTLTNIGRARQNIQRNIARDRRVFIVYVYQEPLQAWEFVKVREKIDGRHVPKDAFIEQYFCARANVNLLKKEFGSKIQVYLIVKNIAGPDIYYYQNIDNIDNHIEEKYTREQLQDVIH